MYSTNKIDINERGNDVRLEFCNRFDGHSVGVAAFAFTASLSLSLFLQIGTQCIGTSR